MHMSPGLSHSDRHTHREHHDSQSLKHPPLPKLFKTAAVIDGLIKQRGINFAASEANHHALDELHIKPATWALIIKLAPTEWEKLKRSPPDIRCGALPPSDRQETRCP